MLRLIRQRMRRERVILPIWIGATALMAYASAAGVAAEFDTDAKREAVISVAIATPSLLALRGLPDGGSLGAYVYFQVFTYLAMLAGLMSTFFVTRHARADEERGRLELLGATPVRRVTPLAATLGVGVLANALLAAGVALGLMGGGLPAAGSWIAGLATGATGVAFVGIGAVASQIAPTSRAANGLGAAAVGLAFVLRAAGDALGSPNDALTTVTSAWPSWISPIGWGQHVFPFTRQELAPLALTLGLAVVTMAVALVAQSRRGLGSSVLRERNGRATGRIRSAFGLAWRQQWPSIIGWAVGGALLGGLAGGLSGTIASAGDLSETLRGVLDTFVPGGQGQLTDLLVAAIISVAGILAAAAGAQAIMRARGEESDGRAELVLASPTARTTWLLGYLLVAVVSAAAVALTAGLVAGLSFLGTEPDRFGSSILAGVAQLPAALSFIALTTLVFAVVPRATIPVGWAAVAVGFIVGQFGGLLQLPDEVRDLSPFSHTPGIPPIDGADWSGAVALLGISLVVTVASVLVVRRRELTS